MAKYWVGGSGNWSDTTHWATSSGGVGSTGIPTAADDCYFDTNSGTGAMTFDNATPLCRSLQTTGSSIATFVHGSSSTLTIGDSAAGAGNIALNLSGITTYTLNHPSASAITFVSTSSTQQTITTNGKVLGNTTINGAGSSYILDDPLALSSSSGAFALTNGTFNTNSYAMSMFSFTVNTGTKTLTLGSSAITITSNVTGWSAGVATGFTMTPNTAVVTLTSVSANANSVILGNINWNGLSFVLPSGGVPNINQNAATIANLTYTGRAVKTDSIGFNGTPVGNLTITGTLTINGNSTVNRVLVSASFARGTTLGLIANAVSFSNVDFMDITAGGASAPWDLSSITGGSGDCQGNSNITFTAPVPQTNTGATGSWSDVTKWTSRVPLPQDDVIINTGSGTITGDMPRQGKSVNFTGFTGTYTAGINTELFGSYTLASGMTFTSVASYALSGRGNYTFTTAGKNPGGSGGTVTFRGAGGIYTLQDTFTSTGLVAVAEGTLDTNNVAVTSLAFSSNTTTDRALILGTTTWTLTQIAAANVWNASATGLVLSAASATIIVGTASANTRTFTSGGFSYGELRYTVSSSTGILIIAGANNSFGTLSVSGGSRTLRLPRAGLTTVRDFNVFGTPGNLITVDSDLPGSTASINQPIGNIMSSDFLLIKDITVRQPYKFYAGTNSVDISNNVNIVFTAPPLAPYIFQEATPTQVNGTSITATLLQPSTASSLLVAMHSTNTGGTPIATPSGWTLAKQSQFANSTSATVFYKIAAGGETGVTITNNSSTAVNLITYEVIGWNGVPELDVTDSNTTGGATSLSTVGSAPTNAAPGYGIAGLSVNANPGAVTVSNDYQTNMGSSSISYWTAKPLTASVVQSASFSWVTTRQGGAVLVAFKDAVANKGNFFEVL